MCRRGREPLAADEFNRRSRYCTPAAPHISGPKFFALANPRVTRSLHVRFTLPNRFVEKANLWMNSGVSTTPEAKRAVHFDEQHKIQVVVGYVAARQQAIDLALVADEDCMELGI